MSAAPGFNIDSRSILVDALKQDPERFARSNLIFKNHKGLYAVFEIGRLRSELLDFAKDPKVGLEKLGPQPKKPDLSKLNDEEQEQAINEYQELMELYELEKKALSMHVPFADMLAIEQFIKPFEDTLHATPAVKGKRFHAFTKQVEDEQKQGFLSGFRRQQQQQPG